MSVDRGVRVGLERGQTFAKTFQLDQSDEIHLAVARAACSFRSSNAMDPEAVIEEIPHE